MAQTVPSQHESRQRRPSTVAPNSPCGANKLAANYLAFVQLASIRLWLRVYVFTVLAYGRAKLCDQALRKLMNIAQKGQNENIDALERPSNSRSRATTDASRLKQALTDLREGIPATQRMLQAAAPAQFSDEVGSTGIIFCRALRDGLSPPPQRILWHESRGP